MKKNILLKAIALGMVLLVCAALAGCAGKLSESDVSYAGPMLDNVLAGMKDKDYNEFSRDFSDTMKSSVTQDGFISLVDTLQTQAGDYQEKTFSSAAATTQNNQNYTLVIYKAKYSKATADVTIKISFSDNNGTKIVEGLWFQ